METIDLMQTTRAAAFTALVRVANDPQIDGDVRIQAAVAILTFSGQESNESWMVPNENGDLSDADLHDIVPEEETP